MYDPASSEPTWEWIEVFNPGPTSLNLAGYYVDRVGDRALAASAAPQILSTVTLDSGAVSNATVVPAGGVAVLYNGDGLDWNPQRFRDAWPQTPAGVPLIGVDGWAGSSLSNAPAPPKVDDSLAGLTFGFWSSEEHYRADTLDLGDAEAPDKRVVSTASADFAFVYDDLDPWPDNDGAASIAYSGLGGVSTGSNWSLSQDGSALAYRSTATFLGEPLNGDDVGSPGVTPSPPGPTGLLITEILYNAESITGSREWEWVEVYNGGPTVNFATAPHWLDDDDGAELEGPNVTEGVIPSGGVGVLFNASVVDEATMAEAWGAGINFIPVKDWSGLNNAGDVVGLWNNASAYAADFDAGETVAGAVTGVVYDNSSPWPSDNGAEAIWLSSLAADPLDPESWSRAFGESEDPNAFTAADVFAPGGVVDNSGRDIGSPGLYAAAGSETLPGDYTGDGRVDAADYTRWRDGGPLLNESASPGVVNAADYTTWAAAYGSTRGATAVPEPIGLALFAIFAGCGCNRFPRRV